MSHKIHNQAHLRTSSPTVASTTAVMASATLPAPPFSTSTNSGSLHKQRRRSPKTRRCSIERRRSIDSKNSMEQSSIGSTHLRHHFIDNNSNCSSSIDIMDFGVPQQQQQRRRSSGLTSSIHHGEAMQRLADSASESNHSELSQVCKDNDGFLGWDLDGVRRRDRSTSCQSSGVVQVDSVEIGVNRADYIASQISIGSRIDHKASGVATSGEGQSSMNDTSAKTPTTTTSISRANSKIPSQNHNIISSGTNNTHNSGTPKERGITAPLNNWKGLSNQNRTTRLMVDGRYDVRMWSERSLSVCSLGCSSVDLQQQQGGNDIDQEGDVENDKMTSSSSSLNSSEVASSSVGGNRQQHRQHRSALWRRGEELNRKESVQTLDSVQAVIVEVSERSAYDSTDDDDDNHEGGYDNDEGITRYGDEGGDKECGTEEEEEVESSSISTSQSSTPIPHERGFHHSNNHYHQYTSNSSTRTVIQGVAYYYHDNSSSDSYTSRSSASSSFHGGSRHYPHRQRQQQQRSKSWRKEMVGRRESVRTLESSEAVIVEVSERSNYSSADEVVVDDDESEDGGGGVGYDDGYGDIEEEVESSGYGHGGIEEEVESLTLSHLLEGSSTQPSLVRKEDRRRATYPREEPAPTLDESFYSVDSKGFMTWKMDHDRQRGIDNESCKEEEKSTQPGLYDDPGSRGKSHGEGGEEDSSQEDDTSVDDDEEKNDGGLLVDWDSNKNNRTSDFRPAQILGPVRFGNRLSRQMRIVSNRLSKSLTSLTSSTTKAAEEEESRKKFASSLPLPDEASELLDEIIANEEIDDPRRRGFGTSMVSELDTIPNERNGQQRRDLGTNRQESTRTFDSWAQSVNSADDKKGDQRRRGLATNREESTRTFDSWAQSVNSADDMKGDDKKGGLLVDWDPTTMTKKMNRLSLNESSNPLSASDGRAGDKEDDSDSKNRGDYERSRTFPLEIREIFEEGIQRRRSSAASGDFRPAQIKLEPLGNNVGNRLSKRMKQVSNKLSSSLTSLASNSSRSHSDSWNLSRSLPSDQREQHLHSPFNRRPLAAWALASSDNGLQQSNRSNTNDGVTFSCVPALSSSLLREGEVNNLPIRICREDNVDILELRRELLINAAAGSAEMDRSRRKSMLGFR